MTGKRIDIGGRPVSAPEADGWVRLGDRVPSAAHEPLGEQFSARLTVDITPELRGRIKVAAFRQGVTVANLLRALFEREFGDRGSST